MKIWLFIKQQKNSCPEFISWGIYFCIY